MESIEWAYDDIGEITSKGQLNNMADFLAHKQLDLVINLPMRHGGARRVSSFSTHGKLFSDYVFYTSLFLNLVLKETLNISIFLFYLSFFFFSNLINTLALTYTYVDSATE